MRKLLLLWIALLAFSMSYGQLTGIKTIPGDYATVTAAVADLNAVGVGTGGVTFNIAAGYTELTAAPILITATGTLTDPIIFQKFGAGANPIVSRTDAGSVATSSLGGQGDAVIIIQGSDYLKFNSVDVLATDAGIEYGYYLRKTSVTDGCKNDTIMNCNIVLNKGTSAYVVGIYCSNNDAASLASSATGITVTSIGGRNENLGIFNNTIGNVFSGIILRGYNHTTSPYDFHDQNNSVYGNTVFNYAGNAASSAYGIYGIYQTSPKYNNNIINNVASGGSNATANLYGIFQSTSNALGDFQINNNVITLGQGSTSLATCISVGSAGVSGSISNNTFSYGTFASTSDSYLITCSNNTPNLNISNNITNGVINKTGVGNFYGIYNNGSPTSGTSLVNFNSFGNINLTGASTFYGIRHTTSTTQMLSLQYNSISNIIGGTGVVYGIYMGYGAAGTNVRNNSVTNIVNGGSVYGIYLGSSAPTTLDAFANDVYLLSTSGASTVYGIYSSSSTNSSIYKNKVYDLSSSNAGGSVYGVYISGGTLTNIYNNYISDLKAPVANASNPIVGLYIGGGTTVNAYYNTIFLNATSSGASFGTSGIYASTTPTCNLINNIIVNTSTPVGTAYTVAYRRSGTTLTSYGATSNTNLFYAGTPGANNLIFYDGTNSDQTLAAYQTRVSPRDAMSITENPPFVNVATTPYDLHMQTTVATMAESGGTPISITTDYDGDTRDASLPDIGADEFTGIPNFTCAVPTPGNTISSGNSLCFGETITLSMQNATSGTGVSYQWQSSADGISYSDMAGKTSATCVITPSEETYYQCVVTCLAGPSTGTSIPVHITFANEITSTTPASRCGTGTLDLQATGSAGTTINWYTAASGGTSIGTGSPWTTPIISSTTSFYASAEIVGTGTLTFGAGASTTSNGDYRGPFDHLYGGMKSQYLIKASELTAAGIGAGNISSLAFDVVVPGISYSSFNLSIGNTALTALTSTLQTGLTTVYSSASETPTAGIYTITFSTPFVWDGTSNIIIETCWSNNNTGGTGTTVKYDITSFVANSYYRADNQTPAVICAATSGTGTNSSRPKMVISGATLCASPRVEVVATIGSSPALTLTADQTACNDGVAQIDVTSTLADYDSYVWTPETDLFTDAACTTPYTTGASATTVYLKSTTAGSHEIICSANNSGTGCANMDTTNVIVIPSSATATAADDEFCLTGSTSISISPATGWGDAAFQWMDSPDNVTFSDIVGANSSTLTTAAITDTTYFKLVVEVGASVCTESNVVTLNVKNPEVLSSTPASRCGVGTLSLEATTTPGTQLYWFDAPTGGNLVGTGSPFTTPVISATTTYYAEAAYDNLANVNATIGTGTSVSSTSAGTPFTTLYEDGRHQYLILASELTAAGLTAGSINSISFEIGAVGSPAMSNFNIQMGSTSLTALTTTFETGLSSVYSNAAYSFAGTGWQTIALSSPFIWDGASNVVIQVCFDNSGYSSNTTVYYTTTATNLHHYGYADGSTGCSMTSPTNNGLNDIRPNMKFDAVTGTYCASLRTPVVATIGAAPALTVTPDSTICNNSVLALNVTSNVSDFDSYVWTPEADLYTDAACTTPYTVGANVSTVYLKSTTAATTEYYCSALNSGTGCTNMDTVEVTVLPAAPVATAFPEAICVSGSTVISVTPNTGYGTATFQWMESSDNILFSDIVGANSTSYTTSVLTDTTYYKMIVELGATVCTESNIVIVNVNNPAVLSTTPATRCGEGTVTLEAQGSNATIINWYDAITGGTLIYSGNSFTTPVLTSTTSYYVEASLSNGLAIDSAGSYTLPVSPSSSSSTDAGIVFTTTQDNILINSAEIFVSGSGNITFELQTSTGTAIASYVASISGATTSAFTEVVFPATFVTNAAGADYRLLATAKDAGITWYYPAMTYPLNSTSGALSITSGWGWGGTYSDQMRCIHNVHFVSESYCISARTAVTATVNSAPAITVTANPTIICQGQASILSATSANTGYSYTWEPGSLSGANPSVSPISSVTYKVTATDNSGGANDGCVAYDSVAIVVNPIPVSLSIDVSDNSICAGETIDLFADAVSGDLATDTIFAESFENAGTIPAGWVAALDVDGNATNAALTYPTTTSYPSGFNAYDGTYLVRFNSFSVGVGNSARLSNSTGFPTTGYDQVDVTFAMMRDDGYSTDNDNVALQYSTDGTTWYTLGTPFSRYSAAGDAWEIKSVTLPDSLENLSTLYIAFLFTSAYGNDVYIDYVNVKGYYPAPATYEWTSVPAGFTSTQQNPMSVAPTVTTQYTVAAFNSYGCSLTADTTVTVNPIPSVYLGADQDICDTTTITLDAGNPGSTFNWSTGGSAQTESILGADLGTGANVVSVTVTSAAGCIGYDEVTITVTVCDGIEDPTMHISYYPNPATDMLNLDLSELPTGDYRFEMFNMQGQKVMDRILVNDGNVILVNLLDIAPGSYVISVSGNNNSFRNYLTIQD